MPRYESKSDAGLTIDLRELRDVYLAGPFFTDEQESTISEVEQMLRDSCLTFYSPRLEQRYEKDSSRLIAQRCMWLNQHHCENSNLILACLSWPDSGTSWEMGWAKAKGTPILGFYGNERIALNLMIRECCDAMVPHHVLPRILETVYKIETAGVIRVNLSSYLEEINQQFTPPEINE